MRNWSNWELEQCVLKTEENGEHSLGIYYYYYYYYYYRLAETEVPEATTKYLAAGRDGVVRAKARGSSLDTRLDATDARGRLDSPTPSELALLLPNLNCDKVE